MLKDSYKESAEMLQKTPEGRAMLAAISCLEDELAEARSVLVEADDYLNTNNLTCIGHGSILHNKFHNIGRA